ncbi:MAG: hemolysin III family protein [Caldilinea sp.]|nr:hemolysin III family protein [Caldilinea sp.]
MSKSSTALHRYSVLEEIFNASTHGVGVLLGVVGLILLTMKALNIADGAILAAALIYGISIILLFAASTLYHAIPHTPTKRVLRTIDHCAIYLLIAGTYTPLSVNALPFDKGIVLLSLVWGGALLGILFRVFWLSAPRWSYVPIYVGLGWAAVLYAGDLIAYSWVAMLLVLLGGIAYTVGALFYGFKRPNPFPGRFGFHELFHTCTAIAFGCHWVASLLIVTNPVGW